MTNELFNQTLAALNFAKRICFGEHSQTGCDNITLSDFRAQIGGRKITTESFLVASVKFDYTPDRYENVEKIILKGGASNISLAVKDYWDNDVYILTDGLSHTIDTYDENPTSVERVLKIYPTANCTIVIISNVSI